MARRGLCINAKVAIPARDELLQLGFGAATSLTTAIQGSISLLQNTRAALVPGQKLMVKLNNECREVGPDWEGLEGACDKIGREYGDIVEIVGVGNELDLWHYWGDSRLTPTFAAGLVRRASPILRKYGIKVAATSVASPGWVAYLEAMANLCRAEVDYVDLHPYVSSAGGVRLDWPTVQDKWAQAYERSGWIPTICSEAGIKAKDAGGFDAQAQWAEGLMEWAKEKLPWECPLVCLFAWRDDIGTDEEQGENAFGLRYTDMSKEPKPAWFAVQRAMGGPIVIPDPEPEPEPTGPIFELGFAAWNRLHPGLLGKPKTKQTGVWPGKVALGTDKGCLFWDNGDFIFVKRDGRIWRWREDWPNDEEVATR